jgi:phosphoglycerate dehydrogenase-like enzyme
MEVRACSRTPKAGDLIGRVDGVEALHAMLQAADFLVIAAPLTEQTRGLIDAAAFAVMKPSAVVVNVSRGAIIDERALYDALRSRRIAGAVIDVWYRYPAQGQSTSNPATLPFHELDNILMTPHASAWTAGLLPRRNRAIADNLNRLARGAPLVNVVRAPVHASRQGGNRGP